MIDLTPLDVRKKKGDFRRTVRGYDPELVDDFLDMVAERLEELVKQNVALTERAEHLQEQVASFREREKALNEALVTAQQLRSEAQVQAEREVELIRKEAHGQAERIVEEGQRSFRELTRAIENLNARRQQFVRSFRSLLERYLSELEVEEARIEDEAVELPRAPDVSTGSSSPVSGATGDESESPTGADAETAEEEGEKRDRSKGDEADKGKKPGTEGEREWLSSLVGDSEEEGA